MRPRTLIATLTLGCFVSNLLAPLAQAATCSLDDYNTASNRNPLCATVQIGPSKVTYPRLQFKPVKALDLAPQAGFSRPLMAGEATEVNLNESARLLNVPAKEVADFVQSLPSSSTLVFVRYSSQSATATVHLLKLEKSHRKLTVSVAEFAPQMGNQWAAARTYMTDAERQSNQGPGPNPFARYARNDSQFHDISFADVTTVAGVAMRYAGARSAVVEVAESHLAQRTEESGNFLRKKVTYIIEGFMKPDWYIGLPIEMQPQGVAGALCAVNEADCAPAHRVLAFANFAKWDGGTLPQNETKVYDWRHSQSSWTVFAYVLVAAALAFGAPYLMSAIGEALSAGMATAFPAVEAAGAAALETTSVASALANAGLGALSYFGQQVVFNGASSPFEAQASYGGKVGWQNQPSITPQGEQATALFNIERNTMVDSPLGESSAYNARQPNGNWAVNTHQFDAGYTQVLPDVVTDPSTQYGYNGWQYDQTVPPTPAPSAAGPSYDASTAVLDTP